jgi:hypothetical protein
MPPSLPAAPRKQKPTHPTAISSAALGGDGLVVGAPLAISAIQNHPDVLPSMQGRGELLLHLGTIAADDQDIHGIPSH